MSQIYLFLWFFNDFLYFFMVEITQQSPLQSENISTLRIIQGKYKGQLKIKF